MHRRPPDRGIIRGTDPTFFAIQSLSPRLSFVEFSESHIAEARRSLKHVQIAIAPSIERFLALIRRFFRVGAGFQPIVLRR